MGVTYVPVTVSAPAGRRRVRVKMLVDSGAVYSLLPPRVWKRLGLKPKRKELFQLPDGTTVERRVSECYVTYGKNGAHSPVILGEPGDDEPLLGAVTLETLGLMLDPFSRRLRPMRLVLMGRGPHRSWFQRRLRDSRAAEHQDRDSWWEALARQTPRPKQRPVCELHGRCRL